MSMTTILLDDDKIKEQEERWVNAIERIESVFPLWHHHAERLHLTMCRGWNTTAAVDGVNLFWNPEFTAGLNDKQLLFLLTHEVFHVAAGHIWRGARYREGKTGRDLSIVCNRLNMAMDYAIHQVVVPLMRRKAYKELKWIPGGLYDRRFFNKSMEQIYKFLENNPDDPANQGLSNGKGPGKLIDIHISRGSGDAPDGSTTDADGNWILITDSDGNAITPDVNDTENPTPEPLNPNDIKNAIKRDIRIRESSISLGAGCGVGTVTTDVLANSMSGKESWEDHLAKFLKSSTEIDFSYRRPNRHYMQSGNIIVPGVGRTESLIGVIAIDDSGSINKTLLDRFGSEVEKARETMGVHEIHIVWCDSRVHQVQKVTENEKIEWKSKNGGGGTSFQPVFDWVQDNIPERPNFVLYFTDGDCYDSPQQPVYPVLFAVYGSRNNVKWAENIFLKK